MGDVENPGRHASGATTAIVAVLVAIAVLVAVLVPAPAGAHESIAGSDPANAAVLEEPISEVTIDFGEPITDDVQMAISLDQGDGSFEDLPGTVSRPEESVARLEFEEITESGRYFVRYIATVASDGHVPAGAIYFDYGEPGGSGTNWWIWFGFGIFSVFVLAFAVWFGLRPRRATAAAGDGDTELATDATSD